MARAPETRLNPIKSGKCSGHQVFEAANQLKVVLIPSSLGNVPDEMGGFEFGGLPFVLIPSSLGNVPDDWGWVPSDTVLVS